MGRITVFTTSDCRHCTRAKSALTSRDIPYHEISLSSYPSKRTDMLALSNRLTVPQVFFNEEHVGGADDTIALLERWDADETIAEETTVVQDVPKQEEADADSSSNVPAMEESLGSDEEGSGMEVIAGASGDGLAGDDNKDGTEEFSPPSLCSAYKKYLKEVGTQPDPTDVRLSIPITAPVTPPLPPPRNEMGWIQLPSPIKNDDTGEMVSSMTVYEVTKLMLSILPKSDLPWLARMYKDCFVGEEGVTAIANHFQITDREVAVQFGRLLQRKQVLHHVVEAHTFGDSWYYFRLQPYQQPKVLNTFRIWTERVDPDSVGLLSRLKGLMSKIIRDNTDGDGKVNYTEAENHPMYMDFEEAVCELQGVNVASMPTDTKLAFGINLYNLMIKHAFIKVGIATTSMQRGPFFKGVKYNVGGDLLSLDDVEHGIVRANTRHPYGFSTPFSKSDPRRRLAVDRLDGRVHFALNCGSKSCPPVNNFTPNAIDEELRIVTEAFCSDDGNVSLDEEKNVLSLSMLFKWYSSDFLSSVPSSSSGPAAGSSGEGKKNGMTIPKVVLSYLLGESKETLQRMIASKSKKITLQYKSYDWSTDASHHKPFDSSHLDANELTVEALYPPMV